MDTTRPRFTRLPVRDVTVDDDFWSPRQEIVRTQTIPAQHHLLQTVGHLEALRHTWQAGRPEPHIFWDSDIAKWIEAGAYSLATTPDPDLEAQIDEVVALLEQAQDEDGYLNSYFQNVAPERRFTDLREAHELYCLGHLIEAAVAYQEATGKTALTEVVRRYADLVDRTFGPGADQRRGYPGHEEIELALVKLYRLTGERRYLELSRYFVDERGQEPVFFAAEFAERGTPGWFGWRWPEDPAQARTALEYAQAHLPVREQTQAVGHSVRAMYLYSAMADLAAETGDPGLLAACRTLWDHLTGTRMYVTGGIGSSARNEGFTADHHLPNETAYAETCAAIGLVMWAQRMADLEDDARYLDVLERALHNAVISGVSADGTHYFYDNPLASDGSKHRSEWFDVACCPPNLARLLTSLGSYVYSRSADEVRVNLLVGSTARVDVAGTPVELAQRSALPRSAAVELTVRAPEPATFTLSLRVPAWAAEPRLRLNGEQVAIEEHLSRGFVRLSRTWHDGDVVALDAAMPARRTWASPAVAADAGRVAIERGPLVLCAEGVDNDGDVAALSLPRDAELSVDPHRVPGVDAVVAHANRDAGPLAPLYRQEPPASREAELVAVPYFSWDNREPGPMQVWVREA